MARYELVKGLPVMTMAEGKQVGKVDDLVIDPERKAVGWLRLHSGGMGILGGERLWVSTAAVHAMGEDVVTINDSNFSIAALAVSLGGAVILLAIVNLFNRVTVR